MPVRTIRFLKNTNELHLSREDMRWCLQARDLLSADNSLRLVVAGHTDGDGDSAVNHRLSLVRAQAVRAELIALGIDPERVIAAGLGAEEPIADNRTSSGKAQNRRVELRMLRD